MGHNRIFVSSAWMDQWVTAGRADLVDGALRVRDTGAVYSADEAVHVVAEVTGAADVHGLVGRVKEVSELVRKGGELLERSLVLGELAYDVVPGFLVAPSANVESRTAAAVIQALKGLSEPSRKSQSDEELLARYLIEKLE